MKLKSKLLHGFLSVALSTSAYSASIYSSALINADGGPSDRVILGTDGSLLALGYAGIGTFETLTDLQVEAAATPLLIATIVGDFEAIESDDFVTGNNDNYGVAAPGNFVISLDPVNPAPLIGKTLYNFIGNGSTLANSTAFVLFKLNHTISADPAPPGLPTAYSLGMNNGTLLFGLSETFTNYSNDDLSISPTNIAAFKLVPEPSAALLGALGALGLLRRRRI
jgi:hypothetical protein